MHSKVLRYICKYGTFIFMIVSHIKILVRSEGTIKTSTKIFPHNIALVDLTYIAKYARRAKSLWRACITDG